MSILDFLKGEMIEIIEWTDDSRDILSYRFPDEDRAIKNGAALIVRESQVVQTIYMGAFGDQFGPGKHALDTPNMPILTKLKSWKFGFESPFKIDVYYINTRLFTANKWGTANPIMMRDDDFGVVRARSYGTYDFRIVNPRMFLKEVAGSDYTFRLNEFDETMRAKVVSVFSEALADSRIPILDVAQQYGTLGDALLPLINPVMTSKYGVEVANFVVENVSLPKEVEEAIDKRSSMAAVGNLNDYVKYQMAEGLAEPGGGAGGMATEMAMGLAIAQQMMAQQGGMIGGQTTPGIGTPQPAAQAVLPAAAAPAVGTGLPELLTPAQVAEAIGVPEADVLAIVESGELKAKKMGTSVRIKRAALDAYLAD